MREIKDKSKTKDRTYILEEMPVSKAIWTLAIPTMVAMLIQVIYNMTNTFFIGKLNNPNMIAAISISMPVFMIIQAFGNVFAIGGASLISRQLGQGEKEGASRTAATAFWTALAICTIVSLIGLIFAEPILMFCGASENTIGFGKSYLTIMLFASPFIGMQMALSGLLRAEGVTKQAMIGMMSGSILNMILDPIFILVFNMGVSGAALGSALGNLAGFSYFMSFYLRKRGVISISPKLFRFDWKIYVGILKIGIPASLGMILMSMGFALANVFARGLGNNVQAANAVAMRATSIAIMLAMGLAQGCQPLMGYNFGAKRYERLMETIKKSVTINITMCVFFAILLLAFPEIWIKVFINDAGVIEVGVKIIRAFAVALPFIGPQMILGTAFQSLGRMWESLFISIGRQGLFFIPALYILSTVWGLDGFVYAQTAADIATTILSLTLYLLMKKKLFDNAREKLEPTTELV